MAKISTSLEAKMREHADAAIETVVGLLEAVDPKVRLAAAREVLDRGFGKPLSAVIQIPATKRMQAQLAAMSTEELENVINADFEELPELPPPGSRAALPPPQLDPVDDGDDTVFGSQGTAWDDPSLDPDLDDPLLR